LTEPSSKKGKLDDRWHKAMAACESGDLNSALFIYRSLVEDGELYALVEVARIYEIGGQGVGQNLEEAAKWYRRAVYEVDDPKAHLSLARLQFNKALAEDSDWGLFEKHGRAALAKGENEAALLLAIALDDGRFGRRDLEKAKSYYQFASDAGYLFARRRLAALKLYSGQVISGLVDLLRATRDVLAVARKNPRDPHLAGFERIRRKNS
jgi:TPR repeat protein